MSKDKVSIRIPRELREKLREMKVHPNQPYYEVIEDILRVRSTARSLGEVGSRVQLVAEVDRLWIPGNKQKQVGLLRDQTGKVKFVSWEGSGAPKLREGTKYLFKGLEVDEFKREKRVKLDSKTKIKKVSREPIKKSSR